jgi:hypothetical protein
MVDVLPFQSPLVRTSKMITSPEPSSPFSSWVVIRGTSSEATAVAVNTQSRTTAGSVKVLNKCLIDIVTPYPLDVLFYSLQSSRLEKGQTCKHRTLHKNPVKGLPGLHKNEISAYPPPRLGYERFPAGIRIRIILGYPSSNGEFKKKHLTVDVKIILHPNAEYNPSVNLAFLQVGGHSAFVLSNFRSARLGDRAVFDDLHFTHNSVKYKRHEAHRRHRV